MTAFTKHSMRLVASVTVLLIPGFSHNGIAAVISVVSQTDQPVGVDIFDATGNHVTTWFPGNDIVRDIVYDSAGNLHALGSNSPFFGVGVYQRTPGGNESVVQLSGPVGITSASRLARSPLGGFATIQQTDQPVGVDIFDATGNHLTTWFPGNDVVRDIVYDSAGNLHALGSNNPFFGVGVYQRTPDGTESVLQLNGPVGITANSRLAVFDDSAIQAIPEPSGGVLIASGILLFFYRSRQRPSPPGCDRGV